MTDDLERGAEAMRQVLETYAQIAKSVIDADPRDTATLISINGYLDEILRHWSPEHLRPDRWELDFLEQQPNVDQRRLREVRKHVAENEKRGHIKEELVGWRNVQRFGLLWWIQRRLRDSGDEAYVEAWKTFVGYFANLGEAARVVDRAVQADFEDRGLWSHWVPAPRHGAFYGSAIDLEFLQTFILIALNYVSLGQSPPQLEPLEWLSGRLIDIEATVRAITEEPRLRPLVPEDGLEERGAVITEAFQSMIRARAEREEQRVIDSPLDTEVVATFKQGVREQWANHRLLAPGFQRAERYEVIEEAPPEAALRWGLGRQWMPKDWLTKDSRVGGLDLSASDLGRALGESEAKIVVEAAADARDLPANENESFAQVLRRAIADLGGYDDLVVIAFHHWRLPAILELRLSEHRGGPAVAPPWLLTDLRSHFIGTADGVPVIESPDVADGRLLVFSLAAFANWRQWRPPGHHEVSVEITSFSEAEALRIATENPDQFRSDERTTPEARARELRRNVLLDVQERLRLEIGDLAAACWVTAPHGVLDVEA